MFRWIEKTVESALLLRSPLAPDVLIEQRHGHTLKVRFRLPLQNLKMGSQDSVFIDTACSTLQKIICPLQHCDLNQIIHPLTPTAERVALWLKKLCDQQGLDVDLIEISDTPSSGIRVYF